MPQFEKYSQLSEAQVYYIIECLASESNPVKAKDKFERDYGKTIHLDLVLQVGLEQIDNIAKLRPRYQNSFDDIPIANERQQLIMLSELYEFCKEERPVAFNKNGDPIVKVEAATALRCIEVANRIVNQKKQNELKEKEIERKPYIVDVEGDDENPSAPMINIVHSKDD